MCATSQTDIQILSFGILRNVCLTNVIDVQTNNKVHKMYCNFRVIYVDELFSSYYYFRLTFSL